MSLQSDIVTALAAIAGGRVYPQVAEANVTKPFVVYRLVSKDPAQKLNGSGITNTIVTFDCWASTYAEAITLAEEVRTAINAATSLTSYEETSGGEDYELDTDEFVEPVTYGFWA